MKLAPPAKLATAALAVGLALIWTGDAFAAKKKYRYRGEVRETYRYDSPRRSSTVAPNGTCQRDTGTHNSNLSFRNRCDTQEFWERMNRARR